MRYDHDHYCAQCQQWRALNAYEWCARCWLAFYGIHTGA